MLKTIAMPTPSESMTALRRTLLTSEMDHQPIAQAKVVGDIIQARHTVRPKHLERPAPDASQLQRILSAAGAAPDHGQVLPWRFVTVPETQRGKLAHAFAQSLIERDRSATKEQVTRAQEKAYRSPLLMLVVVDVERGNIEIDLFERSLSAGCAVQNILLMATALGFGSALTSGKALKAKALRDLFGLQEAEHALCFINIGTVTAPAVRRLRPALLDYVSVLGQAEDDHQNAIFRTTREE
jgi:nitroreductase